MNKKIDLARMTPTEIARLDEGADRKQDPGSEPLTRVRHRLKTNVKAGGSVEMMGQPAA